MFIFGTPFVSFAQTGVEPTLGIKITPEIPGPFENVTINLTSYSTDLSRALINWSVDGKTSLSGYGRVDFSINSPAVGSQKTINISIVTQTGVSIERTVVIAPQDVDLLWESLDSYVPPFYKGRSLPSREGLIKITAVPSLRNSIGSKLDESDLVYSWSQNYNPIQKFSGYGKSTFIYKNAYLDNPDFISLTVSSRDGKQNAKREMRLSLGNPKIVFYPKNPLTSIVSDYSIGSNYKLTGDSVTLVAVPYFFSTQSNDPTDPSLSYSWKINGKSQPSPTKRNELTVKKPSGISGKSSIELDIKNENTLYQTRNSSFNVEY